MVRLTLAGLLALAACTRENPTNCLDNFCNDPSLPFCDTNGIEGTPGACIAVTCAPGVFETCIGDAAATCSASGAAYDTLPCEFGCDIATGGCRRCEPNQTACRDGESTSCDALGNIVETEICALGCDAATGACRTCEPDQITCTNGAVVTCDSAGNVSESVACPLGCFEDEPRCRDVNPSNGLAMYQDMVTTPPDVDVTNAGFDTGAGTVATSQGPIEVPSFLVAGTQGRPDVRVYVVNNIVLRGRNYAYSTTNTNRWTGPAFAIVARGTIEVRGTLTAGSTAGGLANASCYGGNAGHSTRTVSGTTQHLYIGSAGGSHATRGGRGGGVTTFDSEGGLSSNAVGNEELEPLHGGCNAGGAHNFGVPTFVESAGGAIQLTSASRIIVDGSIDVRGSYGGAEQAGVGPGVFVYGGGAGGGILLESPYVELTENGRLIAKGGFGFSGSGTTPAPVADDQAAPGVACTPQQPACGAGGSGAIPGIPAGDGVDATYIQQASTTLFYGGGGGGGLGRVRINTVDGSYEKSSAAIEVADVTTGVVKTR